MSNWSTVEAAISNLIVCSAKHPEFTTETIARREELASAIQRMVKNELAEAQMGVVTVEAFNLERATKGEPIQREMPFGEWRDCVFIGMRPNGEAIVELAGDSNGYTSYKVHGLRMKPKAMRTVYVTLFTKHRATWNETPEFLESHSTEGVTLIQRDIPVQIPE